MRQEWRQPPAHVLARGDEVHVWRASLRRDPSEVAALRTLLSADELGRADRFHFPRDRDAFTVARGGLRTLLGRYLGLPPASLRFKYNDFGKPSLETDTGGARPRFNLSHAGDVALYAVTDGREVGIDVERVREDFATHEVAERFFSRREFASLRALPDGEQTRAFFDCWTRKEAYIKARGAGLSLPLDSFDVTVSPREPAALLETRDDPLEASRWLICELSPGTGYVAAVAVEGDGWSLRCWELNRALPAS